MSARESVLRAFDRLFERAATRLHLEFSEEERHAARLDFAERSESALEFIERIELPEVPEEVVRHMESSLDRLSLVQIVSHLASLPLAEQAQQLGRTVALQAARQQMLDQLIEKADERYGGH